MKSAQATIRASLGACQLRRGGTSAVSTTLGKGVVYAKDTPNFIANRVGIFGMLATIREAEKFGLPVDVVDDLLRSGRATHAYLGIELAAAWTSVLSPAALLAQLDQRLAQYAELVQPRIRPVM